MFSTAVDAFDRCEAETTKNGPSAGVIQQNAAICIIFSVNFLENAINSVIDSLIYSLGDLHPDGQNFYEKIHSALGGSSVDKMPLIEKYNLLCTCLGFEVPDRGSKITQDIASLVNLRNILIHPRPVGFDLRNGKSTRLKSTKKVLQDLRSKYSLSGNELNDHTWINIALNKEGAEWAIHAAIEYWNYIISRILNESSKFEDRRRFHFPNFDTVNFEKARNGMLNIIMTVNISAHENTLRISVE